MAPISKTSQQRNREYFEKRYSEIGETIKSLNREKVLLRKLISALDEPEPVAKPKSALAAKPKIVKPLKHPKPLKSVSDTGNLRGIRRENRPVEGWVFRDFLPAAEFFGDLRNLRHHSGLSVGTVISEAGFKDKMLYAIEAGTTKCHKDYVLVLSRLYGVTITDIETAFSAKGKYIGPERKPPVKVGKPENSEKPAKKEKPRGELRLARAERQNKTDRTDIRTGSSGTPIVIKREYKKNDARPQTNELQHLPANLKYRDGEPGHSFKAYVTRNYTRLRLVVRGLCTTRLWDFEETMDTVHEELLMVSKMEARPDFYGDNERFIAWFMQLCKNLNKQPSQKVRDIEDIVTGKPRKTDYDYEELRAYFKQSLNYKPDYYKVVVEKYVFEKQPIDAAARAASIPPDKAANALWIVKNELMSSFGDKYRDLIKI